MHKLLLLLLALPEMNYATKDEEIDCGNVVCDHDNVEVCGVREGSKEVSFRLFQDQCALKKYGCEVNETKGFRLVSKKYCEQVLFLDNPATDSSVENYATVGETETTRAEGEYEYIKDTLDSTDDTHIPIQPICIQCDCNAESKRICAIREKGAHFIVRWFADTCHMLQYNCEKNLNFTVTDDYICVGEKNYFRNYTIAEETDSVITERKEVIELANTIAKTDKSKNSTCVQQDCTSNSKVICSVRPENERFIIRWFADQCQMLQYNCENSVNFTATDDIICIGDDLYTENYGTEEETQTIEYEGVTETRDASELETTVRADDYTKSIKVLREDGFDKGLKKSQFPRKVVVTTVDIRENINQSIDNFFAATHLTGIRLQELGDETRRMIVKDTGPINIFVPRAFVPANYTPVEAMNESEQYEYAPLVKYCYHKCPKKCPEFYRPVCFARIDKMKQTPFVFFKNHCYMDKAKCMMKHAGYTGNADFSDLEEMGFVFCGGYKLMNTMYMFPLIRILQKMGRLKKKGKVRYVMRNLGQHFVPLQG